MTNGGVVYHEDALELRRRIEHTPPDGQLVQHLVISIASVGWKVKESACKLLTKDRGYGILELRVRQNRCQVILWWPMRAIVVGHDLPLVVGTE